MHEILEVRDESALPPRSETSFIDDLPRVECAVILQIRTPLLPVSHQFLSDYLTVIQAVWEVQKHNRTVEHEDLYR